MSGLTVDQAPAEDRQPGPPRRRCHETTRTDRGYERCHRDAGHFPGTPHHVRDRSFETGGKTPRLQLGQPCGEACCWPDDVTAYYGRAAGPSTIRSVTPAPPRPLPRQPPPDEARDTGGPRRPYQRKQAQQTGREP